MEMYKEVGNLKKYAFVVVDDNSCFFAPDFSSAVSIIPPYGSVVEIIEENHDWVRLRWCGKIAWSVRSHINNQLTEKRENLYRDRAPDVFAAMRRKREAKELRQRFGVGYIESEHYGRVMALLRQIASGQRLKASDVLWLKTKANCWTDELDKAWHTLEATTLTKAWESEGDAWNAVNASAHWRKADEPERALNVTEAALARVRPAPKLKAALLTTRGGVLRDQRRFEEAKSHGCKAHKLNPRDYRPCTLLGAVHFELSDRATGLEWYKKAERLGAPPEDIDQDLRMLLARSSEQEQRHIRKFLLDEDPIRFAWLLNWYERQGERTRRRRHPPQS